MDWRLKRPRRRVQGLLSLLLAQRLENTVTPIALPCQESPAGFIFASRKSKVRCWWVTLEGTGTLVLASVSHFGLARVMAREDAGNTMCESR